MPSLQAVPSTSQMSEGGRWRNTTTYKKSRFTDIVGPVTTDNSPSRNRTIISRSSNLWSASNPAGSDPELLAPDSTSLVAAASTSSLEGVGLGVSLNALGLRTPLFASFYCSCFSASTTSLHLRVGFSSPKPSSSSPPGRWSTAFESFCKEGAWSVISSSRYTATCLKATPVCLTVYHRFGAMKRRSLGYLKDLDDPC